MLFPKPHSTHIRQFCYTDLSLSRYSPRLASRKLERQRLSVIKLLHQRRKAPIRLHQLGLRTDEIVRNMSHATKKSIFENVVRLVHPIRHVRRETHHIRTILRNGRNLGHDNLVLGILGVQLFQKRLCRAPVRTVVVDADEFGRVRLDEVHPLREPFQALVASSAGRADEFLVLLLRIRDHLVEPVGRCSLRRDAVLLGLVKVVHDGLIGVLDVDPVAAGKLGFEMHHRAVGSTAFEFGRHPGIPVAHGGDRTVEVDVVNGVRDLVSIGPVPKKASLFDNHCCCLCGFGFSWLRA